MGPVPAAAPAVLTPLQGGPAEGLGCGPCGACCVLPALAALGKPMHRACDHLRPAAGDRDGGCAIYADRPSECRRFHCLWLQGVWGPDPGLRPDRLGVMFDGYVRAAAASPDGDPPLGDSLRLTALELWPGALEDPAVRRLLAGRGPVDVCRRSGGWERWEIPAPKPAVIEDAAD